MLDRAVSSRLHHFMQHVIDNLLPIAVLLYLVGVPIIIVINVMLS